MNNSIKWCISAVIPLIISSNLALASGYPAQMGYQADNGYPAHQGHHRSHDRHHRTKFINEFWMHQGKPTFIHMSRDGYHFTLRNEVGQRFDGIITRNGELVIPAIHVNGQLSRHGNRIDWSNGTTWYRR